MVRFKFYTFCFSLVCEDLQNYDEHIALIDNEKCSVWGVCDVVDFSLFSERKIFFSQFRVSLLPLHLGSIILFWGNAL